MSDLTHNSQIVKFEKNLKNRVNRRFQKLCHQLENQELNFTSLDEEIKFLNQLYFLHQKINDMTECLEETTDMLQDIKNKKKINKDFRENIRIDNVKQKAIYNLATLVFLNSDT